MTPTAKEVFDGLEGWLDERAQTPQLILRAALQPLAAAARVVAVLRSTTKRVSALCYVVQAAFSTLTTPVKAHELKMKLSSILSDDSAAVKLSENLVNKLFKKLSGSSEASEQFGRHDVPAAV